MLCLLKIFFYSICVSLWKRKIFASFMVIPLSYVSLAWSQPVPEQPTHGGSCEYVAYKGIAEITSFIKTTRSQTSVGLQGREVYEMKFRFFPKEEVDFSIEDWVARTEFLEIIHHQGPNQRYWAFIEANKEFIKAGTILPCILREIVRGSCTPSMFEFPSISEPRSIIPPELDRPKDMRPMRANGTVIAYEAAKSITIQGFSQKIIVLEVSPDATVRGEAKEGARATVYYKREGKKFIAYRISIYPPPRKARQFNQ